MPKEIVSAEQLLDQTSAGAEPVEQVSPVVETVIEPVEAVPPEPGFETPPDMQTEEKPAPSAAELLATLETKVDAVEPVVPPALGSVRSDMASVASNAGALDGGQGKGDNAKAIEEPVPEGVKAWRFVKNIHPGELIKFKDGTEYVLNTGVNVIFDAEVAEKILAVASIYNIVQQ